MVRITPIVLFLITCLSSGCVSATATLPTTARHGEIVSNLSQTRSTFFRFPYSWRSVSDHPNESPNSKSYHSNREALLHVSAILARHSYLVHNYSHQHVHHTADALPPESIPHSLAPVSKQQIRQAGAGLNGDPCTTASGCNERNRCLDDEQVSFLMQAHPCTAASVGCSCLRVQFCLSTNECLQGERCIEVAWLLPGVPFCSSITYLEESGLEYTPVSNDDAKPSISGLNFDSCLSDSECRGSRECLAPEGAGFVSCSSLSLSCVCLDSISTYFCNADSNCENGEHCQNVEGVRACTTAKIDFEQAASFLNDGVFELAEESDGGVCIAIHSLRHLQQDELLYEKPRLAQVLCDSSNSCATPGHMVSYNEELMMMKTYCKRRECTRKGMYVNSPRFRRAMRIESNTKSLSFTAVAARYELAAEERLLSLGVRLGLL